MSTTADRSGRTAKQVQGDRSREEILEAAAGLMSAKGYAATSISDLAKVSGLPASSIYWHFGSKSGVLGAVMERGAARFFHDGAQPLPAEYSEPRDRLAAILRRSAAGIRAHPQFLRLLMILLLGSEGEHAQQEVVERVRTQGRTLLGHGLRNAYGPWGDDVAAAVSEQLVDHLLAGWDGLFIATQAGGADRAAVLLEQMIDSVHHLAGRVRDELRNAAER